ncbi:MAG: hypothetical protein K0Q95_2317 [Bacteroidota bacterium]|nr:hypothetical protein [Bacteroidota bacterium]
MICNLLFSQLKIEEGPMLKSKFGVQTTIVGDNKEFFYVLKDRGAIYFEKYSKQTLALEKSVEVEGVNHKSFFKIYAFKDKFVLLSITNDRKIDKVGVAYRILSENCDVSQSIKLVEVEKIGGMLNGAKSYFSSSISPNHSKLLITAISKGEKNVEKNGYIFDSGTLKLNWNGVLLNVDVYDHNFKIDNGENIISFDYTKTDVATERELKHVLIQERDILTFININSCDTLSLNPKKFMGDYVPYNNLYIDNNLDLKLSSVKQEIFGDTLMICGFFNNNFRNDSIASGTFCYTLNLKTKEHFEKYQNFSSTVSRKFVNKFGGVKLAHQLYRTDENYYLVGEEMGFRTVTSLPGSGGGTWYKTFYYSTIICKLQLDGTLAQVSIIPKNLCNISTAAPSLALNGGYLTASLDSNIYLLQYVNTQDVDLDIKHIKSSDLKLSKELKDVNIAMFKINSFGVSDHVLAQKHFNLQPNLPDTRNFLTNIFYVYNDKAIVFFNVKGKERFGRINLN